MHLLCLFLLISASPGAFGFAINEDEPFEKLFGTKPNQPFVENAIDDHLDIGPNCWSLVTSDDDGWNRIIQFDEKNSSIGLFVNRIRPEVRRCFQEREQINSIYEMTLTRSWSNESIKLELVNKTVPELLQLNEFNVFHFNYVLFPGNYSITFRHCDIIDIDNLAFGCEPIQDAITSGIIPVRKSLPGVESSWCLHLEDSPSEDFVMNYSPTLVGDHINFSFAFIPCHKILPYEEIQIEVFKLSQNESCENSTTSGLVILRQTVALEYAHVSVLGKRPQETAEAVIAYKTPRLESGSFYCIRLTSLHPFCRGQSMVHHSQPTRTPESQKEQPEANNNNNNASTIHILPKFCNFTSSTVFLPFIPFIAQWVPFCTSHFKCGWLYITVIGTAAFLLAFLLALICNLCCCRRRQSPKHGTHDPLPISPSNLDTLKLTDIRPKRTWSDVHEDFYREPPANPGKILLLYSPDSRSFKELQVAFRSFLEMACHCVVLDLFDEELLQAIAYDPETWLDQLLRDDRFKVIVVCSQGAYKRHQAIINGEVLNIPKSETALDGLFSAGLRFLQARQYDKGRLALARYEMLHLCSADFQFDDLGADREFQVPSQLHELFCWIHNYDPLDLLGKPWIRYHLELQLLQDALKMSRMERK